MSALRNTSGAGKFPTPKINEAQIFTSEILGAEDARELKNILSSASGQFYEFDLVIKKSIFGLVVRANVLEQVEAECFRRSGKVVAIKVFGKEALKKHCDAHSENPLAEIAAMQDMGEPRHPNIACQHECCADEKNVYSVLQFHQGVELFDHILNDGPLDEETARIVFRQLVRAMARLEQRGICHRDISLENIMYNSADQTATLIDFGLCVKVDKKDGEVVPISNVVCGKGTYMAPEAAWGESVGGSSSDLDDEDDEPRSRNSFQGEEMVNPFQSDVWSAGMSLLFVLLGFPPVETASRDDVRYNYIVSGRLQELLVHWGVDLSDEVVDLIHAILKEDPSERLTLEQIWNHPWMMTSEIHIARNPEPCAEICTGLYLNNTVAAASPAVSPAKPLAIVVEDECAEICVPSLPSPSLLAPLRLPSVVEPAESHMHIHSMPRMDMDEISTPFGVMSTDCTPKTRGQSFEIVTPTCDGFACDDRSSITSISTTVFNGGVFNQHFVYQATPTSVAQLPVGRSMVDATCCHNQDSQFSTAVNSPTSYYSQQGMVSPDGPLNKLSCSEKFQIIDNFNYCAPLQHELNSIPNSKFSSVSSSPAHPIKSSGSNKVRPYHARSRSKGTNYEFHH